MLAAPTAVVSALENAAEDGLVQRSLVYITAKDRETGLPRSRGVWAGDEDLTITVPSGLTGAPEARQYYGAGPLLDIGDITCTADMTVQSATVDLSQIADTAQQLIREYNARLARIEIHTLYLDPETGQQLGALLDYVGEIDKAPISTPAAGGQGKIKIKAVSDLMSMLTRINARKSSYQDAKTHAAGDEINKYASTVGTWQIPWGQKSV